MVVVHAWWCTVSSEIFDASLRGGSAKRIRTFYRSIYLLSLSHIFSLSLHSLFTLSHFS